MKGEKEEEEKKNNNKSESDLGDADEHTQQLLKTRGFIEIFIKNRRSGPAGHAKQRGWV